MNGPRTPPETPPETPPKTPNITIKMEIPTMTRPFLAVLALLAGLTALATLVPPAQALDLERLSDAERAAFRAEVRAYLLDNPEVIMEAVSVLEQRQAAAQADNDAALIASNAAAIFEDPRSWVGGNPEGDITLVEFMDYRCGYCRRAQPEVRELIEGDGNIRFVVKEFPILGEQSVLAARFAIATLQQAGADAYESIHDALMAFNGDIDTGALRRLGDSLGLDTQAIMARMDSPEVTQVIADNHRLAQKLGISGTPSFVMQERLLRGYLPLEAMQALAADIRAGG
ncbi:MAG: DsbA family protein [Roseovarius sp.]